MIIRVIENFKIDIFRKRKNCCTILLLDLNFYVSLLVTQNRVINSRTILSLLRDSPAAWFTRDHLKYQRTLSANKLAHVFSHVWLNVRSACCLLLCCCCSACMLSRSRAESIFWGLVSKILLSKHFFVALQSSNRFWRKLL